MTTLQLTQEVVGVRTASTTQSRKALKNAYRDPEGFVTVSRNFHIRKEQDDLLGELAHLNSESKVTVLRAIIDEWRDMKLRGCD